MKNILAASVTSAMAIGPSIALASDNVHWLLELSVNQGQVAEFKELMVEMVDTTMANEPGALNYEWYVGDTETTWHIYERYADSDAVMTHLASFGSKFAERFVATVVPVRLVVYGDPSEEVRAALAGFGAVHFEQVGGFTR